jgi:hypothetical protein
MGSGETTARAREPFKPLGQASIPLSYVFRIAHEKAACVRSNVEKAQFDSGARSRRSLLSKVREKKKFPIIPGRQQSNFVFSSSFHSFLISFSAFFTRLCCAYQKTIFFFSFLFRQQKRLRQKKIQNERIRDPLCCAFSACLASLRKFFFVFPSSIPRRGKVVSSDRNDSDNSLDAEDSESTNVFPCEIVCEPRREAFFVTPCRNEGENGS